MSEQPYYTWNCACGHGRDEHLWGDDVNDAEGAFRCVAADCTCKRFENQPRPSGTTALTAAEEDARALAEALDVFMETHRCFERELGRECEHRDRAETALESHRRRIGGDAMADADRIQELEAELAATKMERDDAAEGMAAAMGFERAQKTRAESAEESRDRLRGLVREVVIHMREADQGHCALQDEGEGCWLSRADALITEAEDAAPNPEGEKR